MPNTWMGILLLYTDEVLLLLTVSFSLGLLVSRTNTVFQESLNPLFILCIGFITLCGLAFTMALITYDKPFIFKISNLIICIILLSTLIKNVFIIKYFSGTKLIFWVSLFSFLAFTFIRLSYLNHVILPGYSDSPIHYQVIEQILHQNENTEPRLSIGNIFNNYYHFGFHTLTAWLSTLTGIHPTKAMSLIGQISLAFAPISIAFLTFILSKNNAGALFAGILSIFGWMMPAFAVNWGKFPALLALSTLPAVVGYAIFTLSNKEKSYINYVWLIICLFSVAIMHTRAVILISIVVISVILARSINSTQQPEYSSSIRVSILFILSLIPLKDYFFTFYTRHLLFIVLIILIPFAFRYYSRQVTGVFFYITGIWLLMFLQDTFTPRTAKLLDPQFISMMLYIPFSILGGIGIAGLTKQINNNYQVPIIVLLILIIFYESPWQTSFRPDVCCNYFHQNDEAAFQWVTEHTSTSSLFLISMLPNQDKQFGTDAGVWIDPLTGRNTNKVSYKANWEQKDLFPNKCSPNNEDIYIYSGGKQYSFPINTLAHLHWIKLAYSAGEVKIYKVIKCSNE